MYSATNLRNDENTAIECVEDILAANNWTFDRSNEDEISVQITSKNANYNLFFIWQEEMQALQFCVRFDIEIKDNNFEQAQKTITTMNQNLWMGHFDLPKDCARPSFRYASLLRGCGEAQSMEIIEDMVDIALAQCERFAPLFKLLSSANDIDEQMLSLALMDTAGES